MGWEGGNFRRDRTSHYSSRYRSACQSKRRKDFRGKKREPKNFLGSLCFLGGSQAFHAFGYSFWKNRSATAEAVSAFVAEVAIPIANGNGTAIVASGCIALEIGELVVARILFWWSRRHVPGRSAAESDKTSSGIVARRLDFGTVTIDWSGGHRRCRWLCRGCLLLFCFAS